MKILSVRLKNINSLKGEHFIAFNKSPFLDSGLFAITGPTGAGKSSILDAITLALYGWAPRFHRDSPFEMMSYHTSDCLAEVEFSVKDKVYRSKWSLHRSRGKLDGEIQQPKMELIDVEADVILESKKTEVINKVTEITGLDYFRFLRSVMLAQGDFAAFLRADEKTRGELLEKITGTAIYSQLSKRAFEKQKEKKLRLEQLETQLDSSKLLTPEQAEEYSQKIASYKESIACLNKELEKLTMQMQWLETMEVLRKKSVQLKLELDQVQTIKTSFSADFEKYHIHQQTIPLQPVYREIQVIDSHTQQLVKEVEQINSSIPMLEAQKVEKQQTLEASQQKLTEAKRKWETTLPMLEQAHDLDKELLSLQEQYKKQKNEFVETSKELDLLQQKATSYQHTLNDLSEKHTQIKLYLQGHVQDACLETELGLIEQNIQTLYTFTTEIAAKTTEAGVLKQQQQTFLAEIEQIEAELQQASKSVRWKESQLTDIHAAIDQLLDKSDPEDLESDLQKFTEQYLHRQHQLMYAKEYVQKYDKLQVLQEEIPLNEQLLAEKQIQLSNLKEKEQQTLTLADTLQRLYESESLIMNYETARQQLSPGEACPLCGSTHHPFVSGKHEVQLDQTRQKRDASKLLLDTLRKQIEVANRELSIMEVNQLTCQKDLKNLSLEVSNLEKLFEALNGQLKEKNSIKEVAVLNHKLTQNTTGQQHLQHVLTTYKDKLKIRSQYKDQYEQLQQVLLQLDKKQHELKVRLDNTISNQQRVQQDLATLTNTRHTQQAKLEQMLTAYHTTIPLPEDYTRWLETLRSKSTTYRDYKQQEKEITENTHQVKLELESIKTLIVKTQQEIFKQKLNMEVLESDGKMLREQRRNVLGDQSISETRDALMNAIEQLEQQVKYKEGVLTQQQEQLSIKKQQLQDKELLLLQNQQVLASKQAKFRLELAQYGFADSTHFTSSILDRDTEIQLKNQKEKLEEKINGLKGAYSQNELELKEQGARELTEAGLAELKQHADAIQQEKDSLIAHTARTEQLLSENEQLFQKHQSIVQDIDKFRKEYHRWKILSDMIGSATGAEFNIFAQGLTLARLVFLANRYLDKLNPRYQIRRKPHTDLDLEIIDRYQADNVRSMKTLSGGETFLVSLALALGLSDLAGNKTRIDSLFIDEGFGTLDPQALDVAITTLENLQATGKMIGIISHVDTLKERITTQIQVTKQSSGISKIEVIS